jgi:ribosomal protein L39E
VSLCVFVRRFNRAAPDLVVRMNIQHVPDGRYRRQWRRPAINEQIDVCVRRWQQAC